MNPFAVIFAMCCLAASQARPGYDHGGGSGFQLKGVPDETHYGKLTYPKYDILELGSAIKDTLPPAVVQITKQSVIKIPKPYPVSVPVPHPVPVPVHKPYPVVETKIVKVPVPEPYEVIKKIPVPVEVPKPYPVHSDGGSFGGHDQYGHQRIDEDQGSEGYGGYEGFQGGDNGGGYADADQSGAYGQVQQVGWVPVQVVPQVQEQH